jgi:RNA polymerase sigma-70 factor (ECF subfamily)
MEALAKDVPAPVFDDLLVLVEAMREGKESALEALYDATVSKLYGLASVIVRRGEDAEDVVCATYAHAWANASRYDQRRSSVLGWLLMLCRSRALDVLRQRRAQNALLEHVAQETGAEVSPGPDELLGLVHHESRVRAALEALSPERRELIALAFLRDLTHAEIADRTGLPLGTVKSHLRRALLQLREQLEAR